MNSRLADGQTLATQPAGRAARLVELIHSPDAHKPPAEDSSDDAATDFGSYLPQEAISAALAETCQELRRFLEQRGQCPDAASTSQQ